MICIKPPRWSLRDRVLTATFPVDPSHADPADPDFPVIVIGIDSPRTFQFLPRDEQHLSELPALYREALSNWRRRKVQWESRPMPFGYSMLICRDEYVTTGILDAAFLVKVQKKLHAPMIAVGIPKQGILVAMKCDSPERLGPAFAKFVGAVYDDKDGESITPMFFVVRDGKIVGAAAQDFRDLGASTAAADEGTPGFASTPAEGADFIAKIPGYAGVFADLMLETMGVRVEYDGPSFRHLEPLIEKLGRGTLGAESRSRMGTLMGAYVGETLRRELDGTWQWSSEHDVHLTFTRLSDGTNFTVFPFEKVAKRLYEGRKHELANYFEAVAELASGSSPTGEA